jgi:hypothetical protein
MSLFDVIRYPIDSRFRVEDLERIPADVLREWYRENLNPNSELSQEITPWFLHTYIKIFTRSIKESSLEDLQKKIREM